MTHQIVERGMQWPNNVRAKQTFDTNFMYNPAKPQNGVPWDLFPHQLFPWLAFADENDLTTRSNHEFLMDRQNIDGSTRKVRVIPQYSYRQTLINKELQCYLWRSRWLELGLPDLAFLERENGVDFLRLRALETPQHLRDVMLGVIGTPAQPAVTSFDPINQTITVQGMPYHRDRPSENGQYGIGWHMGLDRYQRDQLHSDAEQNLDNAVKRHTHPYGFLDFGDQLYRYDRLVDHEVTDRSIPAGGTAAVSFHTFHMMDWPSDITVGRPFNMLRHLPYISTMVATCGTFAQRYGFWDFRLRMQSKARQFSAAFLWANYRETFQNQFSSLQKNTEIDVTEWPAGVYPHHNIHSPIRGQMYDYARLNGLDPAGEHPDWDEQYKQQNMIVIEDSAHPHFVDPSDWHTIRVVIWPENNPYGRPGNTVEWYVQVRDGRFLRSGWAALPPEFIDGPLDALQIFLNNAVGGGFVDGVTDWYKNSKPASTDETLPIDFDIAYVRASQFHNEIAGGSGLPAPNGLYPAGFGYTPGDITGNSGTGVVNADEVTIPNPTPPGDGQPVVSGYSDAGLHESGGRLLIPET